MFCHSHGNNVNVSHSGRKESGGKMSKNVVTPSRLCSVMGNTKIVTFNTRMMLPPHLWCIKKL